MGIDYSKIVPNQKERALIETKKKDFKRRVFEKLAELTSVNWNVQISDEVVNRRYKTNLENINAPEVVIGEFVTEKDVKKTEFLDSAVVDIANEYQDAKSKNI